ncbi:protein PLANT CADMIUM RESISTANCE 7-like [Coffea arabica]|uniref:Protein PLANT CADMIUM RESISTANCE 7-like n=1 Tax=Coffea arabica TaxID=13443 RepID=A0A6P6X966_COFAR|nr:protein PLANT CADMIUM RESISTANCE 7-like [Coffea arabica]
MSANNIESNGKSAVNMGQQPAQAAPVAAVFSAAGPWSTGLCGCFEETSNCCVTCCCPCITFGRNVEIIDQGTTSCAQAGIIYYCLAHVGCASCYSCTYRSKLRAYFNLSEDPCNDCLVHCFCLPCAVCQEYRELKNRGLDPSHGWIANVERWNQLAVRTTAPPTFEAGMYR